MRKGQNPAKFVRQVAQPQCITIAVLNYIPFLSGFYAQTLEVLKTALGSLWANTDLPYDLLVFDNGSCQEAIDFLTDAQDEGRIQYLILAEKSMGKGGAWKIMLYVEHPTQYLRPVLLFGRELTPTRPPPFDFHEWGR